MYFGVDYYPELYDIEIRNEKMAEDIELIKGMHMDTVRIMEFAWCEMEPQEGVFCFDWLDEIIDLLGKNGINTILCTPTVAPPMWLSEKYPETLYVNPDGSKRTPGSRHYSCCSNQLFLEKCSIIVEKIAQRYGTNPYVTAFQIDNEISCESNARCCCSGCTSRFRNWLKEKYGDIDTLNKKWGTLFWGQKYQSFEQILPSKYIGNDAFSHISWPSYRGVDSPSLRLDFLRFSSDYMVRYHDMQERILRKYCAPDKLITTNATGTSANEIKYDEQFKRSDVYAYDYYPDMNNPDKTPSSFGHSMARRIKDDGKFWVLETYCGAGHGNWARNGIPQGHPGVYRNNVIHAYASGAQLLTLFKLHAFKSGYEQLGSCLIDLDRVPRRRYYEFAETGAMLDKLAPILNSTEVKTDVAIVFDYDSLWSLDIKPISKEFSYTYKLMETFRIFREFGMDVDIITTSADISKYKLLVLPCFTIRDTAFIQKLKKHIANGATVIATYLTFSKDENSNGSEQHMPLDSCDLFGMRVGEVDYIPPSGECASVLLCGSTYKNSIWTETLEIDTADTIGTYIDTFRKGGCVVTANNYGKGTAYYIGTELEKSGKAALYGKITADLSLPLFPIAHKYGIEIIRRTGDNSEYYFIFNNNESEIYTECTDRFTDILTDETVGTDSRIKLLPMQIRVLKRI